MPTCLKIIIVCASVWIVLSSADIANTYYGGPIHYSGIPALTWALIGKDVCLTFPPFHRSLHLLIGRLRSNRTPPKHYVRHCRSFAGNIPIQRGNNLSLFYWAVEKEHGSLTVGVDDATSPWQVWLNGGQELRVCLGLSSRWGLRGRVLSWFDLLVIQNGPIRLNAGYSASANNYSINKFGRHYLDWPTGVRF